MKIYCLYRQPKLTKKSVPEFPQHLYLVQIIKVELTYEFDFFFILVIHLSFLFKNELRENRRISIFCAVIRKYSPCIPNLLHRGKKDDFYVEDMQARMETTRIWNCR